MTPRIAVALLLAALALPASAQKTSPRKIKTLTLADTIVYATVDRPGDIYAVTKNGQIQKFDSGGKLLYLYRHNPLPTLFDPRDGARMFAYYRKENQYAFLSPGFEMTSLHGIDSSFAIEPWLVCSAGDHNIWIVDAADATLKKINVSVAAIQADEKIPTPLASDLKTVTFMREYQGFVFMLQPLKGVAVFNSLGKWIRTIDSPRITNFNFLGEEMYWVEGNALKFFNLFTSEQRQETLPSPASQVLLTDQHLVGVRHNTLDFFEAKP